MASNSTTQETSTIPVKPIKKNVFISRIKRRFLKHIWLARILLSLGVVFLLLFVFLSGFFIVSKTNLPALVADAKIFLFTPPEHIKSFEEKTNILILGKGGEGHEAPELTDTIIFASISHKTGKMSLISLPRDIWIDDLRAKLNSAYYWGNQKQEKGGLVLAKATVEEIVGLPVHYAVTLDFSGFKKIIDYVEGVNVEVSHSFTDDMYPIAGKENDTCGGKDPLYKCRYETISFEKGLEFMDGERALKFVRSRNAIGDDGTDFARAARQQAVLSAIKDKVLTFDFLKSPKRVRGLIELLSGITETDVQREAAIILARRLFDSKGELSSYVIPEDMLFNPPISRKYDNLYVFVPKEGNWSKLQEWIRYSLP